MVIEVPARQSRFFHPKNLSAVDLDDRAGRPVGSAGFQTQARNRSNRRQRLAAKTQGRNIQQVFGILDLRGRVALEGQQGVVAHHAAAVVGDLDELLAAGLDLNLDARRTGIERVLQQLLHHRRRPLHHFAGGDLVRDVFGENVDAAHGSEASFAEVGQGRQSSIRQEPRVTEGFSPQGCSTSK